MVSIDEVIQSDKNHEQKIIEKQRELQERIASEIEKAKKAVETARNEAGEEEKKSDQKGLAEGKEAAKGVKAEYKAKIKKLGSAYKKNKTKAVDSALKAVLGD